jgi:hypothetical protein
MNTEKLNDWLQIIGIFGLVASLLFVGLQLQQSQDIALSQASQARTAMSVETLVSTAENSLFVSAAAKRRIGEELTLEEQVATSQYAIAILFTTEDQHIQNNNGFLSEERWQGARAGLKRFLGDNSTIPVRRAYERFPGRYSNSFQVVVDELIAEIDDSEKPN